MKKYAGPIALALVTFLLMGCSSLLPQQERNYALTTFLAQKEHYALFTPTSLQSEEKLQVFGVDDAGDKFSRQFDLYNSVIGVMERFIAATPGLSATRIVPPQEAHNLPGRGDQPVLFFHSNWHLVYRRVPPSFSMNQLQVGMIAKVIPLDQVLRGKGPLALRTASWEGRCSYKAFDGQFFHLDDWEAVGGARLYRGIWDAQAYCGDKLAVQFSEHLMSGKH